MSKRVSLNSIKFDFTNERAGITIHDSIEKFRFTLDETPHDHMYGGRNADPLDERHSSPLPGRADLPFSISAWVNLADNTVNEYSSICSKWGDGPAPNQHGAKEYLFAIAKKNRGGPIKTRLLFGLYDDPSNTGTQNRFESLNEFPMNQWVHVVATYGANFDNDNNVTDIVMYQDGIELINNQDGVYSISENYEAMPALNDSFSPLTIGNIANRTGGRAYMPFRGQLADICIFNKKLSHEEVTEIYNGGKVKDMTEFSNQDCLMAWWKMGDDIDNSGPDGILEYIEGRHNGTLHTAATIVSSPELASDSEQDKSIVNRSDRKASGRPRNIMNKRQSFIHGGVSGTMPTQLPTQESDGFLAANQKILHTFWKAAAGAGKTHNIKAFGFNYASGKWAPLRDINGNLIELTTTESPVNTYRLFEISGVDKVYFQQSGDALVESDLFSAAVSSI